MSTRSWLTRAAESYLARYTTTSAHLVTLLRRRVDRRLPEDQRDEGHRIAAEVVADLVERGLLDDARYLADKAASLNRRGGSRRSIAAKLRAKGAGSEQLDEALEGVDDLAAAAAYARKRRLGPYGTGDRDKDLAKLGRAGFSYDVATRVLDADVDTLERLQGRLA